MANTSSLRSNQQNKSQERTLTVRAPGKVLIAGGYLVLEPSNVGLVFAIDQYFYTTCTIVLSDIHDDNTSTTNTKETTCTIPIHVSTPQLPDCSEWYYEYNTQTGILIQKEHDTNIMRDETTVKGNSDNATTSSKTTTKSNSFLGKTIQITLLYLLGILQVTEECKEEEHDPIRSRILYINLIVKGDNDFYCPIKHLQEQNLQVTLENVNNLSDFLPAVRNMNDNSYFKTGLGSSACLVSSIVASLVYTIQPLVSSNSNPTICSNNLNIIHNLSQLCHCYAQGKIGSGFDVSSACYGTHIYQRFNPLIVEPVFTLLTQFTQNNTNTNTQNQQLLLTTLQQTVEEEWHSGDQTSSINSSENESKDLEEQSHCKCVTHIQGTSLGKLIQILMLDVSIGDGGTESPSMAKHVLAWKKKYQQEQLLEQQQQTKIPHWDDLITINESIVQLFTTLSQTLESISDEQLDTVRDILSSTCSSQWDKIPISTSALVSTTISIMIQLYNEFIKMRKELKLLGERVTVPIEPYEQTYIANKLLYQSNIPGIICVFVPGAGGYDALVCLYINSNNIRTQIANYLTKSTTSIPSTTAASSMSQNIGHEQSEQEYKILSVEQPVTICPLKCKANFLSSSCTNNNNDNNSIADTGTDDSNTCGGLQIC